MRAWAATIMAAAMLWGGAAVAQQAAPPMMPPITLRGIGSSASCGSWTTWRAGKDPLSSVASESWVLGFLSGAADTSGFDVLGHVDANGVYVWLDGYCGRFPLATLPTALAALYATIKSGK